MAIHIEIFAIQSINDEKIGIRPSEYAFEVCEDGNYEEILFRRLKKENFSDDYEVMCAIMDHDNNALNVMFENGPMDVRIDGEQVDTELLEQVYREYGILEDELDNED